jgi:hypothetical protein
MNSDSAFLIGSTHEVCQDYAVAGSRLPVEDSSSQAEPYVIISDGCSSSPDTDIGARLLVKAAQRLLLSHGRMAAGCLQEIHEEAARVALSQASLMGLCPQSVDATLLTVHLYDDRAIIGCSGYGLIVLQSGDRLTDVYSISYTSGYPLYPSYTHQPERLGFMTKGGNHIKEVKHFRSLSGGEGFQLEESLTGDSQTEVFNVRASDYRLVAVLSDGVHSFFRSQQTETSKKVEAVSMAAALGELLSFKSMNGAFVRRRLKRFQKDCQLKNWRHLDDLAVGAVCLGD